MSVFDEPKIDCHCHILDPGRFPYAPDVAYRPAGQEIGPLEQYRQVMDAYGIRRALFVGPNSGYGLDNRCMLDAIAEGSGCFKGIAVVPNDIDRAALLRLRDAGVIGVAWNATVLGTSHYASAGPLLRLLAELDMLVSLQVEHDQLLALKPLLEHSGVRILVDHCGRPAAGAGPDQNGFQALLALARTGRVAVKLSGFQKFSTRAPPHDDATRFVRALLDAFTLDACLWATDWPFLKAQQRLDVGPLVRAVERLLPCANDRRRLWWDTPCRWLGFDPELGAAAMRTA
jgi:predicted TIM-barrel fold metal-dependent hydrolase